MIKVKMRALSTLSVLSLTLLLFANDIPAQQTGYVVSGNVVTDKTGEPLPGASVQVRGSNKGTTTNSSGTFNLNVSEDKVNLRISFIGYQTLDTLLNLPLRKELIILLLPDQSLLQEVIVSTGYWESTKKFSTGNISKINAEVIEKQPVNNVMAALIGRMPGVEIVQNTGVPGGGFSIQIRGRNSLRTDGNDPLYIVDGVPFTSTSLAYGQIGSSILNGQSPLDAISPSDIESIEVLKDADATSIYGSRGANGVILITTKKGKTDKTGVDVSYVYGFSEVARRMPLMNTAQYLAMRREGYENDKVAPSGSRAADLLIWEQDRETDWQKKLIGGKARNENLNIALTGGNSYTKFSLRSGYSRQTTVFPGDFANNRLSALFNVNHLSADRKFSMNSSVQFSYGTNNLLPFDLTGFALSLPPNAPDPFTSDGKLNWASLTWTNPYLYVKRTYNNRTKNLIANNTLSYKVMKNITLRLVSGYTHMDFEEKATIPASSVTPSSAIATGTINQGMGSIVTWITEPQINYDLALPGKTLAVLVGGTLQQNVRETLSVSGRGYTSDALLQNLQAAPTLAIQNHSNSLYRYAAFYSRVNFNLQERYILNLTVRRDGSSRFGPDKRVANFGAVGGAWLFHEENAIKSLLPFVSFGKLKASYGITGSDQIPDYGYLNSYSTTTNPYNDLPGLLVTRIPNADYSWESNRKLEAGIELGFLNDAITTQLSWFRNRSSSQLVGYPLSVVTGQASIQNNLPALVQNSGVEFELRSSPLKKSRLKWDVSVNFTTPRNKLVSYPGIEGSSYANTYAVGSPLSIRKRYAYTGIDPESGVYTFEDLDKDGRLTAANDRKFSKRVAQDLFGGINNHLSYKRWELDLFVQVVKQTGWNYLNYSSFAAPGSFFTNSRGNQPVWVLDRWQSPGDITSIQKFTATSGTSADGAFNNMRNYGDNLIGDASFLRLKNVSLQYHLPPKGAILKKTRAFIQVQNAWTWTKYRGLDPENQGTVLPPLRSFVAGLQLAI